MNMNTRMNRRRTVITLEDATPNFPDQELEQAFLSFFGSLRRNLVDATVKITFTTVEKRADTNEQA